MSTPTEADWIPWVGHEAPEELVEPPERHRWLVAVLGVVALAASAVFGYQLHVSTGSAPAIVSVPQGGIPQGNLPQGGIPQGSIPQGGDPFRSGDDDDSGAAARVAQTAMTPATAAQQVGVVDISTVLGMQGSRAAGTGMVLTSSGEILTNNHVIAGATKISVTVVTTGTTYPASVVGYSVTKDIAVLQLDGASGLSPVVVSGAPATVGAAVVGVGNAGGTGGTPSAAAGTVTAVEQTITAQDDSGGSEQLTGLIETDAAIRAGDSGGPLFDSHDQVVGIDTAASAGGTTKGFAIPIENALAVATEIEAGQASASVHLGGTAFLGVQVEQRFGAEVAGVVAGSPAADAGLAAGDVITSVGGHALTSAASLSTLLSPFSQGDHVVVGWTDVNGRDRHATVTLASGPAQ